MLSYDTGLVLCHVFVLVLAVLLVATPVMPPEHAHEMTDAAGHHTAITHHHLEMHGLGVRQAWWSSCRG
jgi:hypothetical protein